jgi:hypothetical protein
VHTVETFTTAVSGVSHALHKNVNWKLFLRLMIPGVIGGALGAYVLSNIHAATAKPFILAYLTAIGLYLLWRSRHYPPNERSAQDRRAARARRRLPRRGGRRRLGSGGDVEPARPGRQPAHDDRHGQHRRILPDRDDLGDLHHPARAGRRSPWRRSDC